MAEIVEDVGVTDVGAMLRVCKVFGSILIFSKRIGRGHSTPLECERTELSLSIDILLRWRKETSRRAGFSSRQRRDISIGVDVSDKGEPSSGVLCLRSLRYDNADRMFTRPIELSGESGGWVEVPDSDSLDITDEITLMCWVYPTQFTNEWFRIIVRLIPTMCLCRSDVTEGNREHYIGSIDEVAIWSVALDEGEIQKTMDQVFAVEPANKLPTSWGAIKGGYLRTPKSFTSRGPSW